MSLPRNILKSTARIFLLIKAATDIKNKAQQIGIDNLKTLIDDGRSITEIYLSDCSPEKKIQKRREAAALLQMGVTPEELWEELLKKMPELGNILRGKDDYVKEEMKKIEAFVRGEID